MLVNLILETQLCGVVMALVVEDVENLSMFLLTISVGKIWSVQSVLEFNAIKKNFRIMSDIERVFWTVRSVN